MIKLSYDEIVGSLTEKTKLPKTEIEDKIQNKLSQLSGLISREGAAHIVAHELGVKLFEQFTGQLKIKNIMPGMRSVETLGKVLQVYDIKEFKTDKREGKVGSLLIGDETAAIRIVLWGDNAEKLRTIKPNSIIKIRNGYVRENTGRLEVHLNDNSHLLTDIKDITINAQTSAVPVQRKTVKKTIKELSENDADVELFATIVQIFDLKFFEICPSCSKRVKLTENFSCVEHGIVAPAYSYLLNVIVDDGTENIRAVCFRNQVDSLLQRNSQDIVAMKDQPDSFEQSKSSLLGLTAKFRGKCARNQFFNRLEFIINAVTVSVDLEKELQELGYAPQDSVSMPIKKKQTTSNIEDDEVPEETIF